MKSLCRPVSSFGYQLGLCLLFALFGCEAQCLIGHVENWWRIRSNRSATQPRNSCMISKYPTSDIQQTMINSNTATLEKVKLDSSTGL
jgi:hypothetical protein